MNAFFALVKQNNEMLKRIGGMLKEVASRPAPAAGGGGGGGGARPSIADQEAAAKNLICPADAYGPRVLDEVISFGKHKGTSYRQMLGDEKTRGYLRYIATKEAEENGLDTTRWTKDGARKCAWAFLHGKEAMNAPAPQDGGGNVFEGWGSGPATPPDESDIPF